MYIEYSQVSYTVSVCVCVCVERDEELQDFYLYIQVLVPEMLRYKFDCLGGLAGFRAEQYRIRALGSSSVAHAFSCSSTAGAARGVVYLTIDLTIRMMQIGQLHHLHL